MEQRPTVQPTQAPQNKPPPRPSVNDVASELLRQGELMKQQSAAMSARTGRTTQAESPDLHHALDTSAHANAHDTSKADDGHQSDMPVSGRASYNTSILRSPGRHTQEDASISHAISHARKALHELTAKELNARVSPAASVVERALDEQNSGQFEATPTSDVTSLHAADAALSPVAAAENDAAHLSRLQQLINRLHKRTSKDAGEPAKPATTTKAPSGTEHQDRALEIERRSRAGLESFIHNADDIVKEEQFEKIKSQQDAKENAQRREQLKLSLLHPVNTDLSSALDAAMTSESMSMPGSFVLR